MARLAVAKKPIKTERFSVNPGEPLPAKYQLASVWEWIKGKFGSDSIEIVQAENEQKVVSLIYERERRELMARIDALVKENEVLKARLAQLESKPSKAKTEAGR